MSLAASQQALLSLLEQLLDLQGFELNQALTEATTAVAQWLGCDKADAFLFDASRSSLVAVGTSDTPLGHLQKKLGLDVLPLANGGRAVETYQTGNSYLTGHADEDEGELLGLVRDLGIRSEVNVALELGGVRRGVLSVVTRDTERFDESDVRVLELIGRWVSTLAHRAELVERLRREERSRARTAAAEEIITVLSHDIRNHLNPLAARLQLLQMKARSGEIIDERMIAPALGAMRRMARLTSGLLDLSRLEHGLFELELSPLDVCELVRQIATELAETGRIKVEAPPGLTLIGDVERLRQAFENVLSNGLRHAPPGSPLRVVIRHELEADQAHVDIADEGPGIPVELLPHLFERFVASPSSKGIGLGLYLAERIAHGHGGSLQARSEPGAGACFRFTLPVKGP